MRTPFSLAQWNDALEKASKIWATPFVRVRLDRWNYAHGLRRIGACYHFEFLGNEDEDSNEAYLWRRSHSLVDVLALAETPAFTTFIERVNEHNPLVYTVQFEDGTIEEVFEHELLDHSDEYTRPDPPKYQYDDGT